jgi:hypothetical protein
VSCWGEFSGAPATIQADGTASGATATAATIAVPTITTTGASDLVLNAVNTANAPTIVAPWSTVNNATAGTIAMAYQANFAAGTATPNVTQTSGTYVSVTGAINSAVVAAAASLTPTRDFPQRTFGPF